MHLAASEDQVQIAELLLHRGARIDQLDYFQLNGAQLELNFSYHTIVIEGLFIDILFDLLISGKSAYVKEFGERYESMSKPNSLYIAKAEVTEIEQ